jgi:antitoxin (DNA-binding transcriptional repressor) of toxin-antitoxin stability system
MKILKDIEHGASLNITSRGRVVAKLVPPNFTQELAKEKLIEIGKKAKIGDVISPIDETWEVIN